MQGSKVSHMYRISFENVVFIVPYIVSMQSACNATSG